MDNLALIQDAAIVCYTDFPKAEDKLKEISPKLVEFTPDEFEIQPESFAQWWDMKDLPDTLKSNKLAVEELANLFIPKFNDFDAIQDKGLALQNELANLKNFQLINNADAFNSPVWSVMRESQIIDLLIEDKNIHNLSPHKFLPLLQNLDVKFDIPISDIAPLKNLKT